MNKPRKLPQRQCFFNPFSSVERILTNYHLVGATRAKVEGVSSPGYQYTSCTMDEFAQEDNMAFVDSHSRFNPYMPPISTNYSRLKTKSSYNYVAATPTTTPTSAYPPSTYHYHYRPASSASFANFSPPPAADQTSFSRSPPSTSTQTSDPPRQYSNPHKNPVLCAQFPSAETYPSTKEDDTYTYARAQKQQEADAQARRARLIEEKNSTLKRMEERQFKAQSQCWFEDTQRLAAEEAKKQDDEEHWRAEEKRRKTEQSKAEERNTYTGRQEPRYERARPQTPDTPSWTNGKTHESRFKGQHGFDSGSERSRGENRSRESDKTRERIDRNPTQRPNSPSSVADAWAAYEKACAELMGANSSDDKMKSNLNFYTIPWPVLSQAKSFNDLTSQNIAAFILSPHHSQGKTPRARLRAAILIWHPDKFAQKVLPRVTESHRLAVSAGSDIIARVLTELISTHGN
ncbi:hypothetical protein RSOLAG1IB_05202 [Rhizoctonia solani AG-1 IB]|uniref:Uncharacterized protein n=1 Tax=Thanatephorus cucumeris (strain AG1-IB / isolate 7/3/14) TaxID=1108050 RepID=A0A0B7G3Z1_THACB|nr:hypothetical protein RSOLAG1IB_05202 [Rhizoctonia solani AG-1 IB]